MPTVAGPSPAERKGAVKSRETTRDCRGWWSTSLEEASFQVGRKTTDIGGQPSKGSLNRVLQVKATREVTWMSGCAEKATPAITQSNYEKKLNKPRLGDIPWGTWTVLPKPAEVLKNKDTPRPEETGKRDRGRQHGVWCGLDLWKTGELQKKPGILLITTIMDQTNVSFLGVANVVACAVSHRESWMASGDHLYGSSVNLSVSKMKTVFDL